MKMLRSLAASCLCFCVGGVWGVGRLALHTGLVLALLHACILYHYLINFQLSSMLLFTLILNLCLFKSMCCCENQMLFGE